MAKIYAIVSNKGGILKSTLTVNIGGELSKKHKVLLLDTDGQSNVAVTFGVRKSDVKHTLFDCLTDRDIDPGDATINVSKNLDIIFAGSRMGSFEKKDDRSPFDLKNVVNKLRDDYDFILIDNAPNLGFSTLQSMLAADELIIPFQSEGYGISSIVDTIKAIEEVKKKANPDLKVNSIVVTLFNQKSKVHKKFLKDVQAVSNRMGIHVATTKIPMTTTGSNSVFEEQKPTTLAKKWYRLKGVYSNLTEEVINR